MFEQITHAFLAARLWLENAGGAGTAFGALCVCVFLLMYLLRKWPPTAKVWERCASVIPALNFDMTPGLVLLSKAWQGLFPTLVAAAIGALGSGGNVKVAILGALAGPVTVLSHEFARWLPFLPYRGAISAKALKAKPVERKSDDDDDKGGGGGGGYDDITPPTPRRPFVPAPASARFALLVATLMLASCAGWQSAARTVDQAAIILCDVFFSQQPQAVGLSSEDVEKAFCSTAEQVAPFLSSAKVAAQRGGAVRLGRPAQ